MSRIRILPEAVANQIAAGEVVERPASVVKELLENALDAGAGSLRVEVEAGGTRRIRVTDDGSGMTSDDALLAFERHATSKLRVAQDLLSIGTLGFRGEALPSIAAVSRLVLETRTAASAEGTRVEFAGGKLLNVRPVGAPTGTSVSVSDLFYCVPARRKFLKSETTELGHIASLVTHYALAHPGCQFQLQTPTQEILNVAPATESRPQSDDQATSISDQEDRAGAARAEASNGLAKRVYQLFGRQVVEELFEIPPTAATMRSTFHEARSETDEGTAELVVRGFASRPQVQRPNRNGIYLFVNRRLVRDRLLLHAIGEAYRQILPAASYPVVLLFLELPYGEVDVNVHPAKIEVRFRHPQFVHDFTRDAIRQALSRARPMASFAAAGVLAALEPAAARAVAGAGSTAPATRATGGIPPAVIPSMAVPLDAASASIADADFELTGAPCEPEAQRFHFDAAQAMPLGSDASPERRPGAAQLAALPASSESLATLKPLGQVNASFIVAVNGEGLWIIDQHVAHERILFERHLRARRAGQLTGQRLLVPHLVELSPRQEVIFGQIAEELAANGFEANPMGSRSVAIQATPAGIGAADAERLLLEILDGVERENQSISLDGLQSRIAASTACHAAIKINTALDQQKMEWLLSELAQTEAPMSCPHGRPIALRYSLRDLERAFQRI